MYFIVINNEQAGPFSMDQLKEQIKSGNLTKQTYVWKEGMANWEFASQVDEVNKLFVPTPPPVPGMPPAVPMASKNMQSSQEHDVEAAKADEVILKAANEDELNEVVQREKADLLCGRRIEEPYVVLIDNNKVEEQAFSYCQTIGKVIIGPKAESIGEYAFDHCENLTEVIIGENVTVIDECAFNECKSLEKIFIGSVVVCIEDGAFSGTSLKSIEIDPKNHAYDNRDNCNAIIHTRRNTLIYGCETTVIPDSVKIIGAEAFSSCQGLTSLFIPEGVTSIGKKAFLQCHELTSITLPESLTNIGELAFCGCRSLTSIAIPKGVKDIGEDTFEDCDSLEEIFVSDASLLDKANVPEDVKIIEW